jgi:hypothetical protein
MEREKNKLLINKICYIISLIFISFSSFASGGDVFIGIVFGIQFILFFIFLIILIVNKTIKDKTLLYIIYFTIVCICWFILISIYRSLNDNLFIRHLSS